MNNAETSHDALKHVFELLQNMNCAILEETILKAKQESVMEQANL